MLLENFNSKTSLLDLFETTSIPFNHPQFLLSGPRPTFWEFIQAVLRDGLLDPHWHPISDWCGLCHLQFDFVIKFENLRDEEDFLLRQLGLEHIVPISWENQNTKRPPWSLELQRQYFSALNSEEMKKLRELYLDDFELFEYDFKLSDYLVHTTEDKGPKVQLPLEKNLHGKIRSLR